MEFQPLESKRLFENIAEAKGTHIIFKHNTTCPISKSVRQKLEQEADLLPPGIPVYILDLLSYRKISASIADTFDVPHESPQLLLIKDGKCIYNQSLYNISTEETVQALQEANS
ncbi:MAG: bacillithiol system protein YtxJ [Segetibacter sp.]|nr:bacillithiol system protein YtxJ [Segetibacter sp.]